MADHQPPFIGHAREVSTVRARGQMLDGLVERLQGHNDEAKGQVMSNQSFDGSRRKSAHDEDRTGACGAY